MREEREGERTGNFHFIKYTITHRWRVYNVTVNRRGVVEAPFAIIKHIMNASLRVRECLKRVVRAS